MRLIHARFGFAGALAGLLVGAIDFALALPRLAAFLPTGTLRFLGFLSALYGLTGLFLGLLLGTLAWLLIHATDLGPLITGGGAPPGDPRLDRLGGRIVAYVVVAGLLLAGVGLTTRVLVEAALLQFHSHILIGAASGVAVAALALGAAMLTLLLGPLVSRLLTIGPRVRLGLRGAPIATLPALVAGLYVTAGAMAVLVIYLLGRLHASRAAIALGAAIGAPLVSLAGLILGYLLYRVGGRGRLRAIRVSAPRLLGVTLLALASPLPIAVVPAWSTVRQLDLRPLLAGALILVGTPMIVHALRRTRPTLALALTVPLLLAALLGFGQIPRVRKATTLVGLAPFVVRGIHAASDFDRDGYSSSLGGGDCDDLEPRVHPGAFDWPDDGRDQNCNGHQASLTAPIERRYADVPASVPEAPNVILLTIDALRADHLSSYGYARPTTPNLDALAKDGVRFENAWAHAPTTRHSVPAILTGRYPSTIQVNGDPQVHWPLQVLPENRLLPEIMKDLGYRTAAMLSYHYFERGWGLDQGFDDYDYHLCTLHNVGGDPAATQGSSARELADLDIAWVRAHGNERFFLWSHFYDPHFQYQAHPDLPESNFGDDEMGLYDGEIRYTDHHIGRLFDALRELGLWDKTILIVTADHGEGFGEHGIPSSRRHGYHLYRDQTKVPILIRAPGLPPRIVDTPIGHVDLVPTLLNLLRRPARDEPELLGGSLVAAMLGDEREKDTRAIYQEVWLEPQVWIEGRRSLKALATRDRHLIRNVVPDDGIELYDLVVDPAEERDLSGLSDAFEGPLHARVGEMTDELAIPSDFEARLKDSLSRVATTPKVLLGDDLGDFARVVGVDIDNDKASLHPGETATITVHLEIKRAVPGGFIVFTRLIGPDGRTMNLDHAPLEGLMPLQNIEPHSWIRDPIHIAIPAGWPSGPLRVELGLERRGTRAPAMGAHSADDAVTVTTLEITPSIGQPAR